MNDSHRRKVRKKALHIAGVIIAAGALIFWLSIDNHPAPLAEAPTPAPAVQTAPMAPGDPWADVG